MTVLLAAVLLALLLGGVVLCGTRVRRLHRLHIRTDAARAGLDAALRRRATVAAGIAAAPPVERDSRRNLGEESAVRRGVGVAAGTARVAAGGARAGAPGDEWDSRRNPGDESDPRRGVRATARVAARATGLGAEREAVENVLGRALARADRSGWPAALRGELADAERLVVLGRHVHNDAVRDTLALRSRRLVRWLHLAGTAPMPAYFEIADPAPMTCDATPDPAPRA